MGVDVDEARRDDPAGGVDRLAGVFRDLADGDDAPVLDPDVALKTPGWPLPSTIVPPVIFRSSMSASSPAATLSFVLP